MAEPEHKQLPPVGPLPYGFPAQNETIGRLEWQGWEFLHWTDIPRVGFAVMQNEWGEPLFVDDYGLSSRQPFSGFETWQTQT
jgi:hypothetical protein